MQLTSTTHRKLLSALLCCGIAAGAAGARSQALCDSENLLSATAFDGSETAGTRSPWGAVEHSTPGSFAVAAADGVLTITKVGDEPWFIYRQRIPAKELSGKTLRYSAELRFDTGEPEAGDVGRFGAGMYFEVRNRSKRKVQGSLMDHEPRYGVTDWIPVTLEFKLPGNVLDVAAGFIHQANGALQVRAPSLVVLKSQPCSDADGTE